MRMTIAFHYNDLWCESYVKDGADKIVLLKNQNRNRALEKFAFEVNFKKSFFSKKYLNLQCKTVKHLTLCSN